MVCDQKGFKQILNIWDSVYTFEILHFVSQTVQISDTSSFVRTLIENLTENKTGPKVWFVRCHLRLLVKLLGYSDK